MRSAESPPVPGFSAAASIRADMELFIEKRRLEVVDLRAMGLGEMSLAKVLDALADRYSNPARGVQ